MFDVDLNLSFVFCSELIYSVSSIKLLYFLSTFYLLIVSNEMKNKKNNEKTCSQCSETNETFNIRVYRKWTLLIINLTKGTSMVCKWLNGVSMFLKWNFVLKKESYTDWIFVCLRELNYTTKSFITSHTYGFSIVPVIDFFLWISNKQFCDYMMYYNV